MERQLQILLLEDNENDAKLIERTLRTGGIVFSAQRVETREEYLLALKEQRPDIILSDFKLPTFDGRSALKLAGELSPHIPLIIVSGALLDEAAVTLLREGAVDYVMKDQLSRLVPAVRRALNEARVSAESCALAESLRLSESKFRRLFEAARDGILLLDATTGAIQEVNPFLVDLLGWQKEEILGKKLWEIGEFKDVASSREAFDQLQANRYVRYDDLPLKRKDGRIIEVEFVSNVYECEGRDVIQCNIRDISKRREVEKEVEGQLDELRRFQAVTVGRELRMKELKEENQRLRDRLATLEKEA